MNIELVDCERIAAHGYAQNWPVRTSFGDFRVEIKRRAE
jgi:hypothetical protein